MKVIFIKIKNIWIRENNVIFVVRDFLSFFLIWISLVVKLLLQYGQISHKYVHTIVCDGFQTYLITFTANKVVFKMCVKLPLSLEQIVGRIHLLLVNLALPPFGWARLGWENEILLLQGELGFIPLITLTVVPELRVRRGVWEDWEEFTLCWFGGDSWAFIVAAVSTCIWKMDKWNQDYVKIQFEAYSNSKRGGKLKVVNHAEKILLFKYYF